jgi:prefoldin subunit 5
MEYTAYTGGPTVNVQDICAIIACIVAVGGILVYIGRSLNTLAKMDEALKIVFDKTDRQEQNIARIDKELTEVKTRQGDCAHCP